MKIVCPRCGKQSDELIECESCKIIGCIRCITKSNKQWICSDCKNGKVSVGSTQTPESALAAMFG